MIEEYIQKSGDPALKKASTTINLEKESDLTITIWQRRDATMAANFEKQRQQFAVVRMRVRQIRPIQVPTGGHRLLPFCKVVNLDSQLPPSTLIRKAAIGSTTEK